MAGSSPDPLVTRWRSEAGTALAEEVVARLVSGRKLDELELDTIDGRIDLRGLSVPAAARLRRFETKRWFVETLGNLVTLRKVRLVGLDLTDSRLENLRFHGVAIVGCRFDRARCRDWRMWATSVTECSFRRG